MALVAERQTITAASQPPAVMLPTAPGDEAPAAQPHARWAGVTTTTRVEPSVGRKAAHFVAGIGLGLLPLLIVSLTLAATSRLGASFSARAVLAGFAVAGAVWLGGILAMIVLLTRRHLRFIAYGLLAVIVALPVAGAALWTLILVAAGA